MWTSSSRILSVTFLLLPGMVASFNIEGATDLHFARSVWNKRQNTTTCNGNYVQAQCNESPAACVDAICAACAALVDFAQCCALASLSAKVQCLEKDLENPSTQTTNVSVSYSSTSGTIPATTVLATSGLAACAQFESIVGSCESQTPGFQTAPFNSKAGCLCYLSGTYQPSIYDGALSGCLAYVSTADPADYGSFTAPYTGGLDLAPCRSANLSTTPSSTLTSTPASTTYIGHSSSESQRSLTTTPTAAASQSAAGVVATSTPNPASVVGIHRMLALGSIFVSLMGMV